MVAVDKTDNKDSTVVPTFWTTSLARPLPVGPEYTTLYTGGQSTGPKAGGS